MVQARLPPLPAACIPCPYNALPGHDVPCCKCDIRLPAAGSPAPGWAGHHCCSPRWMVSAALSAPGRAHGLQGETGHWGHCSDRSLDGHTAFRTPELTRSAARNMLSGEAAQPILSKDTSSSKASTTNWCLARSSSLRAGREHEDLLPFLLPAPVQRALTLDTRGLLHRLRPGQAEERRKAAGRVRVRPRHGPGSPRGQRWEQGSPRRRLGSLTCRERWLVSSGSSSGNSFRSMPPQSTTPSWVQPQSRGQAGPAPGALRRSGPPSGKSLPAADGRAAAQPSASSPSASSASASSARPPAGIAPASREAGSGRGGTGLGPAEPPAPPARRVPGYSRRPAASTAPSLAPQAIYCLFHTERCQTTPEIYRGGYAVLFVCSCRSSQCCTGKELGDTNTE